MFSTDSSAVAAFRFFTSPMKSLTKQKLSVLIVDDEEPIRKFVERVLRDAGYETTTAAGGPQAIERAKSMRLDLVVTDVNMPAMTGDELARQLRQREPSLKVLYLTGFADQLFKEKAMLWQDEAFLDKPCSVKGLLQAVALLTSGHLDRPGT
jgi:two-component system cell cycle sensor histidine kinase/response regulator CckA